VTVEIGAASPSQFSDILEFWRVATEVASSTDDREGLQALYQQDPDACLVATEAGAVIGTLIVGWDGWRGAYYRLAVHPDHRRRGLARRLVGAGEERLRRLGTRRVNLFAVGHHEAAVTFWPAVGYQPDPSEVRFVRNLPPTAGE
jgi:ribosomal protein S18 acetylase RimI-like enzyme